MPNALLLALRQGPLVLDGALGTQLLSSGFDLQRDFLGLAGCCEALNLTRPEQVQAVHESYLDAGCDVLATNTFLAAPHQLARRGLEEQAAKVVERAARAAVEAAAAWSTPSAPRWVLGSLGPGWQETETDPALLEESWANQAKWLTAAGVDALLLETFTDPELLAPCIRGARRGIDRARRPLPLFVSLAAGPGGQLAEGEPIEAALDVLAADPPDLLALNCLGDLEEADRVLARLRARWSGLLGAYPSAGLPQGNPPRWLLEPKPFGEHLAALAQRHSLVLVGGCCGTRPEHIAHLAQALGRPGANPVEDAEFGEDPGGDRRAEQVNGEAAADEPAQDPARPPAQAGSPRRR